MLFSVASRRVLSRSSGQCRKIAVASNDLQYFTFPKEQEGNIYAVNWSLVEDGVVANGSAFRNARLQQLQNQMKSSTKPAFDGKYTVEEAGDNLDHATFHNYLMEAQQNLSSAHNLFVEDGFVGAHRDARTGVRLITASAHSASLLRKMLIPTPRFDVDPRARFDGWNLESRWKEPNFEWNGTSYVNVPDHPRKGQRPIVVYDGLIGKKVALQFIQSGERIVGANIVIGSDAPRRSIIDTIGYASAVLNNSSDKSFLHLPCATVYNGKRSVFLVNANDSILSELHKNGVLFSPYFSAVSVEGISSLWNGVAVTGNGDDFSDNMIVSLIEPDNLAPSSSSILVLGDSKPEQVIKLLESPVEGTSEGKLQSFVTNSTIHAVADAKSVLSYINKQ